MRLRVWGDRVVGLDGSGLRAWDVTGTSPALVAECAFENTWFDSYRHDVGGACTCVLGDHVLVGARDGEGRAELVTFDARLELVTRTSVEQSVEFSDLAWSPDRGRCATHANGDGVVILDAVTGDTLREFGGHISSGAAWSPDGRLVAAADSGQAGGVFYLLRVDEADDEEARVELALPSARQPLYDSPVHAAFSADGALVAFTSVAWGMRGVAVYEVASGAELWSTKYEMSDPDAELWDAQGLAFLRSGETLVVGVELQLRGFDTLTGAPRGSIEGYDEETPAYFALDEARGRAWTTQAGELVGRALPRGW